jgi:xylulokinase
MAHQYILNIDVGTSSTKTTLWNQEGKIVAETSIANLLNRPDPVIAEIDGRLWWQVVCQTIRRVISQSGINPDDIAGIGVDGVGLALVPVDRNVNPLAPVMIWLDRRASREAAWLKSLPESQHLLELVANPLDESYVTPKLVWLRNNHPEIFEATYQFLGSSGYIVARLTGEFTCDFTQAYAYHFFDMKNERWDPQAANMIGIPLEKMPRLYSPNEVVGTVTRQVAIETGLRAGTPVIAGCLDAIAGALGAGVTQPGQTNEQGGQAGGFGISVEHMIVEPRLVFSHHLIPGQYLLSASTVGGGVLGWFRDQVETENPAAPTQVSFERYSSLAITSPPGANGLIFLPYMAGERTPLWSNTARGVFFGLSYSSSRADILRAMMEGCAFAVYDNLDIAAEHGAMVTEFLGSGGASKSPEWCQIKADVYGLPFVVAQRADGGEGGNSLGLFAVTAHAIGLFEDIAECVNSLLSNRRLYEPSERNHTIYQELFQVYRSISRKLLDEFGNLDQIRTSFQGKF